MKVRTHPLDYNLRFTYISTWETPFPDWVLSLYNMASNMRASGLVTFTALELVDALYPLTWTQSLLEKCQSTWKSNDLNDRWNIYIYYHLRIGLWYVL